MSLTVYGILALSSCIFLAASSAIRVYAGNAQLPWLLFALLLYCIGNYMMVRPMREGGMAIALTVSAIAQLLLANIVAYVVFGERLTMVQYVGLALGFVAILLVVMPQSQETAP